MEVRVQMKCEICGDEHSGNYGSGRFCSSKCAKGFSTKNKREEINLKISKKLKGKSNSLKGRKFPERKINYILSDEEKRIKKMHAKDKGEIGHLAVAKDLLLKGYSVFTELGDNSRVDLITLKENRLIKVQVKSNIVKKGVVAIDPVKSGPNYSFRYTENDVDVFALYLLGRDKIAYVSSKEVLNTNGFMLRVDCARNNQQNAKKFSDYIVFEKAIF